MTDNQSTKAERQHDITIDRNHFIRVNLFTVGGAFLILAGFFWQQLERQHDKLDTHIRDATRIQTEHKREVATLLSGKANKRETSDRYTGKQAGARDIANREQHEAFRRELDHYYDDLKNHGHDHSEIIHNTGHKK